MPKGSIDDEAAIDNNIVSVVYRELLYQSYTSSRISGLRPLNVESALRMIKWNNVISSILPAIFLSMVFAESAMVNAYPASLIMGFAYTLIMTYSVVISNSYGLDRSDYIWSILVTLALDQGRIRRLLIRAFYRSISLTIYLSIIASIAFSLLTKTIYALVGVVQGVLLGIALASLSIITNEGAYGGVSRPLAIRVMGMLIIAFGGVLMGIMLTPLSINVVMSLNNLYRLMGNTMAYIPVLSGMYIGHGIIPMLMTLIYTLAFAYAALVLFSRMTQLIFSPKLINTNQEFVKALSMQNTELNFRISNKYLALVKVDFRQLVRSRLISMLILFVSLWAASTVVYLIKPSVILSSIFAFENGLLSTMIPYGLYMSEVNDALTFRVLPISPLSNLASKLIIAILLYYLATLPILAVSLIHGASVSTQYPVLFGSTISIALTSFLANLYEYMVERGGVLNPFVMFLYAFLASSVLVALPITTLFIVIIFTRDYLVSSIAMAVTSLAESSVLMFILARRR